MAGRGASAAARNADSRVLAGGGPQDFPAFTAGLAESGYENGRNVNLEFHSVGGRYDQLPIVAEELVRRRVAVIAPMGIDAAQAAKEATSSIPIVFVIGVDPIKFGFVRSLNHPGGNVTGMSLYTSELHAKRVELMDEFVPTAAPIGMIINPKMPDTQPQVQGAEAAAQGKGHPLVVVKASDEAELDEAFAALAKHHVAGVLAVSDNFLSNRRDQIMALAARYAIPVMYPFRNDAVAGGLLSYGTKREPLRGTRPRTALCATALSNRSGYLPRPGEGRRLSGFSGVLADLNSPSDVAGGTTVHADRGVARARLRRTTWLGGWRTGEGG